METEVKAFENELQDNKTQLGKATSFLSLIDFFKKSECRAAVLSHLLRSNQQLRISELAARPDFYRKFPRKTLYKQISILNKKGFILHHKTDNNESYIRLNPQLPAAFQIKLEEAVSKSCSHITRKVVTRTERQYLAAGKVHTKNSRANVKEQAHGKAGGRLELGGVGNPAQQRDNRSGLYSQGSVKSDDTEIGKDNVLPCVSSRTVERAERAVIPGKGQKIMCRRTLSMLRRFGTPLEVFA